MRTVRTWSTCNVCTCACSKLNSARPACHVLCNAIQFNEHTHFEATLPYLHAHTVTDRHLSTSMRKSGAFFFGLAGPMCLVCRVSYFKFFIHFCSLSPVETARLENGTTHLCRKAKRGGGGGVCELQKHRMPQTILHASKVKNSQSTLTHQTPHTLHHLHNHSFIPVADSTNHTY